MSMAAPRPPLRAPYKMDNGLMRCERCDGTYSRGNWCRGWDKSERGSTTTPKFERTGDIPDDECPFCGTKEEQI